MPRALTEQDRKQRVTQVFVVLAAIAVIIVAFVLFITMNNARINEQVDKYLQGSTEQTARRIDDWMGDSLREARLLSAAYEETIDMKGGPNKLEIGDIEDLAETTKFDYVMLSTTDGETTSNLGVSANVSESEFFKQGMAGKEGVAAVDNSPFSDGMTIVYYAPLMYNGKIVGVISGAYNEDYMEDFLTAYFFGKQTSAYLCKRDGTVVAHSFTATAENGGLIQELYAGSSSNSDISYDDLDAALHHGASVSFDFESSLGSGRAYVMQLPSQDWMVMRTFPSSITTSMTSRADLAGIVFVAMVAIALGGVGIYFVLQAFMQRRRAQNEKDHMTGIVASAMTLFQRFALVDLDSDTYEYLKVGDLDPELPRSGEYSILRYYWQSRFEDKDEGAELNEALTPRYLRENLTPDVPYLHLEYHLKDLQTDEPRWFQTYFLPLTRRPDGTVQTVLMTVQDVTVVKTREVQSRLALEEAFHEAQSASNAKSDFLNSMSHDIRTPMNTIMGLTAIASMHVEDPARVKDCLGKITSASRHLLGLINEVLDMAKIESGNLTLAEEDFALPEAMESVLSIIRPQLEEKHQVFQVEVGEIEHEHLVGDRMRLQQVFVNILGNSVKFTEEGGTIGLNITELESNVKGAACYEFVFSDTGCGMDENLIKTMFDPFVRAHDSRVDQIEGTGLGMPIVRCIVGLMQGTIDVKSRVGEGTIITIVVYLKLPDCVSDLGEDVRGLEQTRLLFVGNETKLVYELMNAGLRAEHCDTAEDAVLAVRYAEEAHDPYRLITVDDEVQGESGIEVIKRIKREISDDAKTLIAYSGYEWVSVEADARAAGAVVFMSKPLFRSRVVHTLRGACGEGNEDPRNEYRLLEESDFSGYRVLLVEDNEIAASIALDILGMTGVEVERAENGKKAVEKVLSYEPGHFDLIFMDVQMPVMNGYQAATALREAAAGHGLNGEAITPRPDLRFIPIVALTADAFADDIARAHAAGMDAHMSKPMEIGLLIKTLQERLPGHKASQSGGEAYSRQFARDEINEETAIINSQQEKQETVGEPAAAGVGEPSAVEAESIELSAGAEKSAAGAESEHLPEGHKAEEEENTLPRDSK